MHKGSDRVCALAGILKRHFFTAWAVGVSSVLYSKEKKGEKNRLPPQKHTYDKLPTSRIIVYRHYSGIISIAFNRVVLELAKEVYL